MELPWLLVQGAPEGCYICPAVTTVLYATSQHMYLSVVLFGTHVQQTAYSKAPYVMRLDTLAFISFS